MFSVEFSGGRKILEKLEGIAKKAGISVEVNLGFEDAYYPDGTSVRKVAETNEYGSATQPPRPFFRNMVAEYKSTWSPFLAKELKKNGYDIEAAMAKLGDMMTVQLKQSIMDTNSPPLAESTIRRKGSDKPLIESELMYDSVGVEIIAS